jgi:hypothetical protein
MLHFEQAELIMPERLASRSHFLDSRSVHEFKLNSSISPLEAYEALIDVIQGYKACSSVHYAVQDTLRIFKMSYVDSEGWTSSTSESTVFKLSFVESAEDVVRKSAEDVVRKSSLNRASSSRSEDVVQKSSLNSASESRSAMVSNLKIMHFARLMSYKLLF